MLKTLRWTWPILLLAVLFLVPWGCYLSHPVKEMKVVVLDKTVPFRTWVEHRSLFWLMDHLKIRNGAGEPYNGRKDYLGAFPGPEPGDRPAATRDLALSDAEFERVKAQAKAERDLDEAKTDLATVEGRSGKIEETRAVLERARAAEALPHLDEALLSLHGPDAATHDALAGRAGSFDTVTAALRSCAAVDGFFPMVNSVLTRSNGDRGIISSHFGSDGNLGELLYRPAGGNHIPFSEEVLESREHLLRMSGREVFKAAVRSMAESAEGRTTFWSPTWRMMAAGCAS